MTRLGMKKIQIAVSASIRGKKFQIPGSVNHPVRQARPPPPIQEGSLIHFRFWIFLFRPSFVHTTIDWLEIKNIPEPGVTFLFLLVVVR